MKIIFSTEDYDYLKNEISSLNRDWVAGDLQRKRFPDGERYLRVLSHVKDNDCIIIGGTHTNDNTVELFDLGSQLVSMGAKTLTLVIPYFGHSTMERAENDGEVVKAKTRANLLSHIPKANFGNRIFLVELHAETIVSFFSNNIVAFHLHTRKFIIDALKDLVDMSNPFVLATTDVGRSKHIQRVAREFPDIPMDLAFIYKRRESGTQTNVTGINADVKGKIVVIYDDMIRTGGSLVNAAKTYREHGATQVFAISTHGIFPEDSAKKIRDSKQIDKIIVSDSHPSAIEASKKMKGFIEIKSIIPTILPVFY